MHTFLSDILHVVAQALLVPDIILLLFLIGYALFCIGSVLVEYFTERRYFAVVMPRFLGALTEASDDLVPSVIEESGLLKRQKAALKTVFDYRGLPGDALIALVKRLMSEEESHYDRIVDRNNMAAKVAPMLGLMGTLIPLGPGIQALGQADTAQLSSSLLVAFDTTVAGLVAAAVCLVIGKVRSGWYNNYLSALDSSMATMLQKIEDSRIPGQPVPIPAEDPGLEGTGYDYLFKKKESDEDAVPAVAAGDESETGSAFDAERTAGFEGADGVEIDASEAQAIVQDASLTASTGEPSADSSSAARLGGESLPTGPEAADDGTHAGR